MRLPTLTLTAALALLSGFAYAQAQGGHAGHQMPSGASGPQQGGRTEQGAAMQSGGGDEGHNMAPGSATGSWAHTAATNPPPHQKNRWEMAPVGDSPLYVSASGMSREERCAALKASSRVMVDEATKAACAGVVAQAPAAHAQMAQAQPQQATAPKASGTVNSVDAGGRKVNVTHGPIPQIGWPGMTMDLAVSDKVDLKSVKPGDKVEFTIKQGSEGIYMIDSISK